MCISRDTQFLSFYKVIIIYNMYSYCYTFKSVIEMELRRLRFPGEDIYMTQLVTSGVGGFFLLPRSQAENNKIDTNFNSIFIFV